MATQLFKLVIDATTTTGTDINPDIQKFFYKLAETERTGSVVTIPSTLFEDDNGDPVATNLPTITTDNGYYLLFVNGVLQQEGLYTAAANQVVINDAASILVNTAIVLVVNNFAPASDSDTTITT